jgi:L-ectoine synthase
MIVRTLGEVLGTDREVDHGNSVSRRLLVAVDARGYALTDTYIRPGTDSRLRYDRHLEACYCIEGSGRLRIATEAWDIEVGTVYAPDQHEEHWLTTKSGMRLVCVFSPALEGEERHSFDAAHPSGY